MLRPGEMTEFAKAQSAMESTEKHLVIVPFDRLRLRVYTNAGEIILDPNFELRQRMGGAANQQLRDEQDFMVLENGTVKMPLIGYMQLEALTIDEAEKKLQEAYNEFYEDAFVMLRFINKRVVLLGGPVPQVINLENENMNLLEVLSLGGGLDQFSRSYNIKLVRGSVNNPEIFLIDLSTIEGMKNSMLNVQPGDVIYVEQQRRIFTESVRDISMVAGLFFNFVTILLLVNNL